MQVTSRQFTAVLRIVSKKGFYSILKELGERGELRYHEIQKAAEAAKVVDSRSQVDVALRLMSRLGLLDRAVSNERPPTTRYRLSKKGKETVHYLRQLEEKLS